MFSVRRMALGARVRFYREKLKLRLEDLSAISQVDVGTISALENRDSKRSQFAGPLAKAFGLTIEQLQDDTRDWLDPNAGPPTPHVANAPAAGYVVPTWPFSQDLFLAVRRLRKPALDQLENLIRAHLDIPPLPAPPPAATASDIDAYKRAKEHIEESKSVARGRVTIVRKRTATTKKGTLS